MLQNYIEVIAKGNEVRFVSEGSEAVICGRTVRSAWVPKVGEVSS